MLKLTEAFMTYLKLAMWAGLLVASPVVLYQLWAFVAPGLYRHEKRLIAPLVVASTILFVLGAAFTYYLVLPFAFKYLILEFATGDVKATLSMSSYVSSTCLFMATFGLIFQIPLVMLLLARMGIIKGSTLARNRKYVLLGELRRRGGPEPARRLLPDDGLAAAVPALRGQHLGHPAPGPAAPQEDRGRRRRPPAEPQRRLRGRRAPGAAPGPPACPPRAPPRA